VNSTPATLLIVDDEIQNRKLLEVLLRPEGYLTLSVASGEEALATIAQRTPDLILLDVMMPGMDGYQVARALKASPATSNIPIIMLTAQLDRGAHVAGLNAGAEEFLTKPIDRAELCLRVRNLLRLKTLGDFLHNHNLILEREVRARTVDLQRFRTAMDATTDAIFLVNRTTMRFIEVNATACNMLGYSREELLQIGPAHIGATTLEELARVYDAIIAGSGTSELAEIRLQRKDGSLLLVEGNRRAQRSGADWVIVGIVRDITERKQAARNLRESERRFSDLLRNVELAAVMLDREARVTFCNAYLLRLTGWTNEQVIGRDWFELFIPPEFNDEIKASFAALLTDLPEAWHRENEILTCAGERRLMRWNNSVLRSGAGDVIGTASIGEDITEQRRAEIGIKRLNRVHAVLSGINTLILRVRDRDELFKEACRIAVEHGGLRMSLIAIVDRNTRKIVPVASAGVEDELLAAIGLLLSSTAGASTTMIAHAIREARTVVSNDSQSDPQVLFGKQYIDAGVNSMAVLPLIVSGEAVGVLALYASEVDFFQADELKLLAELAGDVAFAIDHIEKQEKLDYLAYYDTLTGLSNRTLFHETLKKTLAQASENGWQVAVLCIDMDLFKNVNDTLGHAIGDELLRQFGSRLVRCVRPQDTVGRLGGDEFALIVLMQDDKDVAVLTAKKICDAMREPFELRGNHVVVTASIGITVHPVDASDPDTLMKYADTAMYRAKQAGRDTFRFFTAQMNAEVLARLELGAALRKAVSNEEFVLYYQPKVQLRSGHIDGFEALLRWQRPGYGLVMPEDFIPGLEDTGLIARVGSWVIASVCKQISLWMRSAIDPVQVSVNVSGRQFIEGDLEGDVLKALADYDVAANQLELELTESSLMANTERTIVILQNLKKQGVQISIDDFGTGYSSLAYLRRFPIDKLKIDIAFIRDVTSNPDAASIVRAIVQMAHSLKMDVIAEGVETAAQLVYLRRNGCDQIQGYYFSPPLDSLGAEQMLRAEKCLPAQEGEPPTPINTLLLVDDEANILTTLKRMFRQDGYNILSARSAAEAFELLALHEVHVILCDQRMPAMSGTDFLDQVKEMYPDTLRIILSGYTDLKSIIDAINRGSIYRFYTKPWDNNVMRANLQAAFRHYWLLRAHSEEFGMSAPSMRKLQSDSSFRNEGRQAASQ